MLQNEADREKSDVTDDFPKMTIVGNNLGNCIMYISIGSTEYGFQNPILGLDACFKLFYALNCSWPSKTNHIWQFIDLVIYKLAKDALPNIKTQVFDIFKIRVNVND